MGFKVYSHRIEDKELKGFSLQIWDLKFIKRYNYIAERLGFSLQIWDLKLNTMLTEDDISIVLAFKYGI